MKKPYAWNLRLMLSVWCITNALTPSPARAVDEMEAATIQQMITLETEIVTRLQKLGNLSDMLNAHIAQVNQDQQAQLYANHAHVLDHAKTTITNAIQDLSNKLAKITQLSSTPLHKRGGGPFAQDDLAHLNEEIERIQRGIVDLDNKIKILQEQQPLPREASQEIKKLTTQRTRLGLRLNTLKQQRGLTQIRAHTKGGYYQK